MLLLINDCDDASDNDDYDSYAVGCHDSDSDGVAGHNFDDGNDTGTVEGDDDDDDDDENFCIDDENEVDNYDDSNDNDNDFNVNLMGDDNGCNCEDVDD